ncbi:MAG: geranyl transferase [Candidatus Omnitrophica bacterium CG11_big_fil_rev_8_21_14_0_20_63_9]|nr:MAG: geranyl transferase [Candidatus Omnitrophica bacterium CG11_big_fil_rev_8_21_14_0_20_63_9]
MTVATKPSPQTKTRRLEQLAILVDQALERLLPDATAVPPIVHEAMRYCVLGRGKRFRPLLCLGAAEAVGAQARQALPVACALELVHTYSLVHDDLPAMDNADERRGQATCHRKFGEGNAILVGDALLTLAFEVLGRNGTPNGLEIVRIISHACGTTGLIGGQVLDLQAASHTLASAAKALTDIAQRKTAALIAASVVTGALAGGANANQVRAAQRYGQDLGLAFQLIDDMHDQDGLAAAMGVDAARDEAHKLISRAVKALEPFGRRADMLRQMADWLESTSERAPTR